MYSAQLEFTVNNISSCGVPVCCMHGYLAASVVNGDNLTAITCILLFYILCKLLLNVNEIGHLYYVV